MPANKRCRITNKQETTRTMNTTHTPVPTQAAASQPTATTPITLETTVGELFGDQPIPPGLDADAIGLQAQTVFGFLPAPLTVTVQESRVTLTCPEPSPGDCARAQRLADKAAAQAVEGRCHRAIEIWKQALKLNPFMVHVWRDIGMAATELRQFTEARRHLTTALLVQPDDVWSLVALAKMVMAENQDLAQAEAYARRAVAQAPDDPWALNCLGALLARSGREEAAVAFFAAAIRVRPEFAPPYLSLACLHFQQGRVGECLTWLKALFSNASAQDVRCNPVFTRAVQLMRLVEGNLASQN